MASVCSGISEFLYCKGQIFSPMDVRKHFMLGFGYFFGKSLPNSLAGNILTTLLS